MPKRQSATAILTSNYRYRFAFRSLFHQSFAPSSRILVIGEPGVGKTSLIARYIRNEFPCRTYSHINADGSTVYPTVIDGTDCILTFVEINSVNEFVQLTYSTAPTACLLMFSITDERSFNRLPRFQEAIRSHFPETASTIPILILANKIDCEHDRTVSQSSIDKLKVHGYHLVDVSVKGNVGIGDAVYTAIKHLQHEQYYLLEQGKPDRACVCLIS